jgi:hypothetical protein
MVRSAVESVLNAGYRTGDILTSGTKPASCGEMGDLVAEAIAEGV